MYVPANFPVAGSNVWIDITEPLSFTHLEGTVTWAWADSGARTRKIRANNFFMGMSFSATLGSIFSHGAKVHGIKLQPHRLTGLLSLPARCDFPRCVRDSKKASSKQAWEVA